MFLGRSVIGWLIAIFIAVCLFLIFKWLIPLLFGAIGVPIPDQIATILALLIAVGFVWWGPIATRTGPPA